LEKPLKARYIKVENVKVPDGKFSIYDLRIFGKRKGKSPAEVKEFTVDRDAADTRRATISWPKNNLANGYVINYGTEPEKLYTSVMVYGKDSLRLTGLNTGIKYFFSIDAFNESGISKGTLKISQ
jgi:hypothetical protein